MSVGLGYGSVWVWLCITPITSIPASSASRSAPEILGIDVYTLPEWVMFSRRRTHDMRGRVADEQSARLLGVAGVCLGDHRGEGTGGHSHIERTLSAAGLPGADQIGTGWLVPGR